MLNNWPNLLPTIKIPFDIDKNIIKSVSKTNNLIIIDEDMPGGASAYILQQLLKKQKIFKYLDSEPILISSKSHRPAYGSDGDYFSKPSFDDIFEAAYKIMHNQNPNKVCSMHQSNSSSFIPFQA